MPEWLIHLWLGLSCTIGFAAIALSMERHQRELLRRRLPVSRNRALRGLGWVVLAQAAGAAITVGGWGLGLTLWAGHLSAAAGAVFLGLVCVTRAR